MHYKISVEAGGMGAMLKGKQREEMASANKGPLNLLDLPLDILKEIVQKVTHTNDLASLALTHSALHDLAIPHIYSRFDIVWPEPRLLMDSRGGVDALTYGLATLVMGEDIFQDATSKTSRGINSGHCHHCAHCREELTNAPRPKKRKRGNHYAQYTKKFSLGNGPLSCVSEYAVTKESGKMLGTLIALALARMHNLETFVWDMPTGILRDVWTALSSLGDRHDFRLQKVWIRWHDSRHNDLVAPVSAPQAPPPPPVPHPPAVGSLPPVPPPPIQLGPLVGAAASHPPSYHHVIHPNDTMDSQGPTFSTLCPLKSLSVLDIDQLEYLDEMSILIGKSRRILKELRIGISHRARTLPWVAAWEGDGAQQSNSSVGPATARGTGEKRLGGVLGVLVRNIYDMRQPTYRHISATEMNQRQESDDTAGPGAHDSELALPDHQANEGPLGEATDAIERAEPKERASPKLRHSARMGFKSSMESSADAVSASDSVRGQTTGGNNVEDGGPDSSPSSASSFKTSFEQQDTSPSLSLAKLNRSLLVIPEAQMKKLNLLDLEPKVDDTTVCSHTEASESDEAHGQPLALETLEMERFPLSVSVLQNAIDWGTLTSLTILDCANAEQLWKTLRKIYSPQSPYDFGTCGSATGARPRASRPRSYRERAGFPSFDYELNLKKLHTNIVSPSLMSFLKETLAPNSLEVLFLQDSRSSPSVVTVDTMYRGPLRRHRASLTKLLIDSSEKNPDGVMSPNARWGKWMLDKEALGYITSGRMPRLRELSIALDYDNWHFFLQRLPSIPHLRSMHIPFIAHRALATNVNLRDLALHIIDIVALRPEMELCYIGISNKCFEILELPRHNNDLLRDSGETTGQGPYIPDVIDEDEDDDDEDEEAEDESDEGGVANAATEVTDSASEDGTDDSEGEGYSLDEDYSMPKLGLREILFFDDKVAIFKARHGRL